MTQDTDWLAIERDVLERLKPFQRKTVEWAFECLFPTDGRPCSGRFLVADEVGLGKTLVARGVLAKTLRHLQGKTGRVDVVYICSNADIAKQNVSRLTIPALEKAGFLSQGRLTLMPLIPRDKDGNPERASALPENGVNFQALTPGTSLDFRNDPGHAQERALLALMVADLMPKGSMTRLRNLFTQQVGHERFQTLIEKLRTRYIIDPLLQKRFSQQMRRHGEDGRTLVSRLVELSGRFQRQRGEKQSLDRLRMYLQRCRSSLWLRSRLVRHERVSTSSIGGVTKRCDNQPPRASRSPDIFFGQHCRDDLTSSAGTHCWSRSTPRLSSSSHGFRGLERSCCGGCGGLRAGDGCS